MLSYKEIEVPDIGDYRDVPIIEVLVKEGESIDVDTPLVTLESDKATMDVPSPLGGKVQEIMVDVDDTVSAGTPLILLEIEVNEPEKKASEATGETPIDDLPTAENIAPAVLENTTAIHEISVPDIGDYTEVEVIEVHIQPGDHIQAEDPLITLESDKATMDVPAPIAGEVQTVNIKAGDRVSAGDNIAQLMVRATPAVVEAPAAADSPPVPDSTTSILLDSAPTIVAAADMPMAPARPQTLPAPVDPRPGDLPHASPSIRRFARDLGVELTRVSGSGVKGRIQKEDVQEWVKLQLSQPQTTMAQPAAATTTGSLVPEIPTIDFSQFGEIEVQALGRIKKLTAANLHRSWLNVPHVTQHDEADITELEAFRQDLKREQETQGGARITLLSFLMKACVVALKRFPQFNSSLQTGGENLVLKKYYHLGIAVETKDGLVVPVVRDVDRKSVSDLAGELDDISGRARNGKLAAIDLQGASFTISSLGGIGGTAFTPIINAPEVAILGVSRSSLKPVYIESEFVPRLIIPLSLSYDHRVVDGAEAARFTSFLATVLKDVRRLLL